MKERNVPSFTIQNRNNLNKPRKNHINTNQHTLIEMNLKA